MDETSQLDLPPKPSTEERRVEDADEIPDDSPRQEAAQNDDGEDEDAAVGDEVPFAQGGYDDDDDQPFADDDGDPTGGAQAPPTVAKADEHYARGITCIKARDFIAAVHCFSKAIFLSPGEPLPYVARAEAFTHLTDLRSAIANYRRALTLMRDPVSAEDLKARLSQVLDTQGIIYFRAGNADAAMRFFLESLAEKYHPLVDLHRCLCLISKGESTKAEETLQKLAHDSEAEVDATVLLVQLRVKANDFATGRQLLESVLYRFQDHPRLLDVERMFDTAFSEYKSSAETSMNVEALGRCIAAFPEDAELYRMRAISHANRKSYTLAVQDLFTCINKSGGSNPEAASLMATLLCTIADELVAVEDYIAAVNYYTEALKWDEDQLSVYISRGDCLSLLGKHEQALKDFKHVNNADPGDMEAKARLARLHDTWGSVLYNQGKYELAETEFTRAVQYTDDNPVYFYHRALCRLMLQQPDFAVRDLISCRDLGATDPEILKMVNQFCKPSGLVPDVHQQPERITPSTRGSVTPSVKSDRSRSFADPSNASANSTQISLAPSDEMKNLRTERHLTLQGKYNPTAIRDNVKTTKISAKSNVMVVTKPNGQQELMDVIGQRTVDGRKSVVMDGNVKRRSIAVPGSQAHDVPVGTRMARRKTTTQQSDGPVWRSSRDRIQSRMDRAPVTAPEPIPARYTLQQQLNPAPPPEEDKTRMVDLTGNATRKAIKKESKLKSMIVGGANAATCQGAPIRDLISSGAKAFSQRPATEKVPLVPISHRKKPPPGLSMTNPV